MGGVVDSIFGGGDDAPSVDPAIGQAAAANAEVAADALDFYKQVYAESKPRQAATDALSKKLVEDQLATSGLSRTQATEQYDRYKQTFVPLENKVISDANTIDSAGELSRVAGQAATGVQAQFDNARGQSNRAMAAMGVNPNSGKSLALAKESSLGLAASKATAANNARTAARDRGVAMRSDAANLGRNLSGNATNAYNTAVSSGNSAMSNNVAAANTANQSAATMGNGYSTAMAGYTSAANALNNQYNNQLSAWSASNNNSNANAAGLGTFIGTLLSSSSKDVKQAKTKIDYNAVLHGLRRTPVEAWEYKEGEGDGGKHIGPYAEDVQQNFGDKAAPGGKAVDLISLVGIGLSAIKALDQEVESLKKKDKKRSGKPQPAQVA